MTEKVLNILQKIETLISPYKSVLLAIVIAIGLWISYRICTRLLKHYMEGKAHKPENVQNFLLIWRYAWLGVGLIVVITSLSGSIASLGISAAFLGMVLGWSLQAPVTGVAAWLMIILKRPFKIGDRIIVSGIIGDVIDINLTHIVLNQVGGTVSGEEKSGRGVMIPNATLFQQVIYNYTFQTNFILDEVPVLVSYESDIEEATKLLLEAARSQAEV
ncbi:MAG: mechanosensitive ion channel family protein, partial [Lentisphaerae bacterium]